MHNDGYYVDGPRTGRHVANLRQQQKKGNSSSWDISAGPIRTAMEYLQASLLQLSAWGRQESGPYAFTQTVSCLNRLNTMHSVARV